jgi:hypothetical protein
MLAGTRYELAFRRAVSQAVRPPGLDRRGTPAPLPRAAADLRPALANLRAPQTVAAPTPVPVAARERT